MNPAPPVTRTLINAICFRWNEPLAELQFYGISPAAAERPEEVRERSDAGQRKRHVEAAVVRQQELVRLVGIVVGLVFELHAAALRVVKADVALVMECRLGCRKRTTTMPPKCFASDLKSAVVWTKLLALVTAPVRARRGNACRLQPPRRCSMSERAEHAVQAHAEQLRAARAPRGVEFQPVVDGERHNRRGARAQRDR